MSKDRELLQEALQELKFVRIFVTSREKIAPVGAELYNDLIARIDARLAEPQGDAGRLADELDARVGNATNLHLFYVGNRAAIQAALRSQPAGTPAWAVKGPDGVIDIESISETEKLSIDAVSDYRATRWRDLERDGYTCVSVLIVEKP